jgi:hypothetical protein
VRAGDFLLRMAEMQPAPDERFYTTLDEQGRLITEYAPEAAEWRVVQARAAQQRWFAVGLPFAFAILLHDATGEERFSGLVDALFAFQSRGAEPWDVPSSGKAGWGCSILYRKNGEPRYREIALRVAQQFMGYQTAAGYFTLGAAPAGAPEPAAYAPFIYDVTAEFVLWLTLIANNVLARDAG